MSYFLRFGVLLRAGKPLCASYCTVTSRSRMFSHIFFKDGKRAGITLNSYRKNAGLSILPVQPIYFLTKVKTRIVTTLCGTISSRRFEVWATCMLSCFAATEAVVLKSRRLHTEVASYSLLTQEPPMRLLSTSVCHCFRQLTLLLGYLCPLANMKICSAATLTR